MTATEELRHLLDECSVEYAESQDRFRTRFRFDYCEACNDYLNEIEVMDACIIASKSYLTPKQAVAATLGGGCYGGVHFTRNGIVTVIENAADGFIVWCMGETYFKQGKRADFCTHYDTIEQAIVAALGGKECEIETDWDYIHDVIPDAPEDTWGYRCGTCGWAFRYDRRIKPNYCPNCGKVVK